MADVFVSYSHEDQDFVRRLVPALEAEGLSVWWDHTIPPGKTWNDFIARGIAEAKACIIIWSPRSVVSDWVQEEATLAKDDGKYLPVQIGGEQPPIGFRRIQAANLTGWSGDRNNAQFRMFAKEAVNLARGPNTGPAASVSPAAPPPAPAPTGAPKGGLIALIAIAAIALVGGYVLTRSPPRDGAVSEESTPAETASPPQIATPAPAGVPGTWALETSKRTGCGLTGTLVADASTPGVCKLSVQWKCTAPAYTQFVEESCTYKVDGDKVRIDSVIISNTSSDNVKRAYLVDTFDLTIAGDEMKGSLKDGDGSLTATFTRQN